MRTSRTETGKGRRRCLEFGRFRRWCTVVLTAMSLLTGSITVQAADPPDRAAIDELPVVELPAEGRPNDVLAIILSGDGGWADLDKVFGEAFQKQGLDTVGFDCLKYFWKTRQPEEVSQMLDTVLRYYLHAWNKKRVLLVGYSFGACWMPFLVNRLPADLLAQVELCVLLGPSDFVNVEIRAWDWMGDERRPGALEVLPEARRISKPLLCVYGTEERNSVCPRLQGTNVTILARPGDHHYNQDYPPVIEAIFETMSGLERRRAP